MQDGLPSIASRRASRAGYAYTPAHRRCFPAPARPPDVALGALAVASPYASYLQSTAPGRYRWDLGMLTGFEGHPGLVPLGAVVDFELDPRNGTVEPVRIETARRRAPGTQVGPRPNGWRCARSRRTVDGAALQLAPPHCGPTARSRDPQPIAGLAPDPPAALGHMCSTHEGNLLVTAILMSKGGEFDSIFSLTHRGMCELFDATTGDFDLASINPLTDAARRGVGGNGLATPAQDHWSALYRVILDHVHRYVALYYGSDDDVVNDQALGAWIDELDRRLPNGVSGVLGPAVTMAGVESLLATLIHLAVVEHEITGSGSGTTSCGVTRHRFASTRTAGASRSTYYQRLVNANLTLNVNRTMLLNDEFVSLALDERGAWAFREFQQDMLGLQARLDAETPCAVAHRAAAPEGEHQRDVTGSARKRSVLTDGQKR